VRLKVSYQPSADANLKRPGYPDSITITFDDVVRDTSLVSGVQFPAKPAKFRVVAHTADGDQQLDFRFRDVDNNGTLSLVDYDPKALPDSTEVIDVFTYLPSAPTKPVPTWRVQIDTLGQASGPVVPPALGDTWDLFLDEPLQDGDLYTFTATGEYVNPAAAKAGFTEDPYVVPNPYIGSASFEPARFATGGRGERRIEFRGLPAACTIRIYSVRGELVQTLRHDGSVVKDHLTDASGMVPWDLRTKDNLDAAPGLYIFQVDAPGLGTRTGKFAVVK
jgi:hypothetical protein